MQRACCAAIVLAIAAGSASASLLSGFEYDMMLGYDGFLTTMNAEPFTYPGPTDGRLDVPFNQQWEVNADYQPGGGKEGGEADVVTWNLSPIDATPVFTDAPVVLKIIGLPDGWGPIGDVHVSCLAGADPLAGASLPEGATPNGWSLAAAPAGGQMLIMEFTPDGSGCDGGLGMPPFITDLSFEVELVPEPATLGLMGLGLIALLRRRF